MFTRYKFLVSVGICFTVFWDGGLDSSVGVATHYWLNGIPLGGGLASVLSVHCVSCHVLRGKAAGVWR